MVERRKSSGWVICGVVLLMFAGLLGLLALFPTVPSVNEYLRGDIRDPNPGVLLTGQLIVFWSPTAVFGVAGLVVLIHGMRRSA